MFYDDYNLLNDGISMQYNINLDPIKFKSDNGLLFQNNIEYLGWAQSSKYISKNVDDGNIVVFNFQGNSQSGVIIEATLNLKLSLLKWEDLSKQL